MKIACKSCGIPVQSCKLIPISFPTAWLRKAVLFPTLCGIDQSWEIADVYMTLYFMQEPVSRDNLGRNSERSLAIAIRNKRSELSCPKHIIWTQLKKAFGLKTAKR